MTDAVRELFATRPRASLGGAGLYAFTGNRFHKNPSPGDPPGPEAWPWQACPWVEGRAAAGGGARSSLAGGFSHALGIRFDQTGPVGPAQQQPRVAAAVGGGFAREGVALGELHHRLGRPAALLVTLWFHGRDR